jgi:16S rRNA (uracil1498-N3)-methyltransferase
LADKILILYLDSNQIVKSMTTPRLYVSAALTAGERFTADQELSKRLLRVLRLKLYEKLILFNGQSCGEFLTELVAVVDNRAVLQVEEFIAVTRESPVTIHLGQGIARGEKMDFIIQKGTELGLRKFTPLFTEYCNVKFGSDRHATKNQHWQAVAVSAAEQSGRCITPQVDVAQTFSGYLKESADAEHHDLRLILHPMACESVVTVIRGFNKIPRSIDLLVGPEGGFSEDEITLAKQHGFVPVSLGPRVLRTETAALVVTSILQAYFGDLR